VNALNQTITQLREHADALERVAIGPNVYQPPEEIGIRSACERLALAGVGPFEIETTLKKTRSGVYSLSFKIWDGEKFHESKTLVAAIVKCENYHTKQAEPEPSADPVAKVEEIIEAVTVDDATPF
jgi:hypothetical protein